jgi:NAD(P)-dependent dehydrogenase (short-subunit alcohol dehydrogenase family)
MSAAFVTGGGRGMGKAIASALAQDLRSAHELYPRFASGDARGSLATGAGGPFSSAVTQPCSIAGCR